MGAGIVFACRFIQPGQSKGFGRYLDYVDRPEAFDSNEIYQGYEGFTDYMAEDFKSTGLFGSDSLSLSAAQKKETKKIFKAAEKKGSNIYQQVFSFETDFLRMANIITRVEDKEVLNEERLKEYTAAAVEGMLNAEGFSKAHWCGSIHTNTEHVHIHIAMVDESPSWNKGEGRCFSCHGNLLQRGKFKEESLRSAKREFVNNISNTKEINAKLNEIIRQNIITKAKDKNILSERNIKKDILALANKLPNDRRLLKYNNNAMKPYTEDIDAISLKICEKYFKPEFEELKMLAKKQGDIYKSIYGENSADYYTSKMADFHARFGNMVLKEVSALKGSPAPMGSKDNILNIAAKLTETNNALGAVLKGIQTTGKKDLQSLKNQMTYDRLREEEERGRRH